MNILEAIKSEKRFRRPYTDWNYPVSDFSCYQFMKKDFLADDWQIEEKSVEITRENLFKALSRILVDCNDQTIAENLANELGL